MKKIIAASLLLAIMILPFVSADLITPGTRAIVIENRIANLADFPDYSFLAVCSMGPQIQSLNAVNETGLIGGICYKFSDLSVYSVKKSDFNETYLRQLMENDRRAEFDGNSSTKAYDYINSVMFKKVIEGVEHYAVVPDTSTQNSIVNEYHIDLTKVLSASDNSKIERNNLMYVYIGVSVIALVVIIYLLIRKTIK